MRYFFYLFFVFLASCDSSSQGIALGTLERNRIAHTATTNEVVIALPVPQGSIVKKGDVLVKLDDTLQKARVSQATAEVAKAEANFEKLRNGARVEDVAAAQAKVSAAKALLIESEANYTRSQKMTRQQVISDASLDNILATRNEALANVQHAQEELRKLTNGTRAEDLRGAEASLEASKAVLTNEKKRLADLTIVATRDGILDSLPWNLGERVTTGSPLAILLAGKAPYARVYVPEPYRLKLKVGATLTVLVDGLKNPITGRLRWISTDPAFTPYYALNQDERSRLMYLAEVQLPDSAASLANGIPAQVLLP